MTSLTRCDCESGFFDKPGVGPEWRFEVTGVGFTGVALRIAALHDSACA